MAASSTTTTSLVSDGWTALAGSYTWEATACAGSRIAVEYSVSDAGHLALGPIAGGTAVVETAADRIEVRFADGVRIRITARNDGDGPRIDRDERRDCDGVDDGGTDGDGDGDSDDDDDSEGSGEGDDTADGVDDEAELERLNSRLLDAVNATGRVFLSHTKLNGKYTVRLAVGNVGTREKHVAQAWDVLKGLAVR